MSNRITALLLLFVLIGFQLPLRVMALSASSFNVDDLHYSIPFQGMNLTYYSETTPVLYQQTGLAANGWILLLFHDLTNSSSKVDISVNGNVTESGQQSPAIIQTTTVDFPTNQDTILFLRNGGQQNLQIYSGPAGQAFQLIPGYSFALPGVWNLHDESFLHTSLGSFDTYRYHNSVRVGNTTLDIYVSYDRVLQVLLYGEVYASQNGGTWLVEKLELRATNLQFTTPTTTSTSTTPSTSSPQCVIATAAYGSELALPVQFLREFRDRRVEKTYLGSEFMTAFNAWYYSWAPTIARLESDNEGLRAMIRILILPLLGSLFVAEKIFDLIAPLNPEVAIMMAGVTSSALLGLFYFTPIFLVPFLKSTRTRTLTKRKMVLLGIIGALLTLTGTITHGTFGIMENLTALAMIETTLLVPVGLVYELCKKIL